MSNFNFVQDGGCKLPPGFRFQPTDEEIIFQYLARKTFAYPLPALVIPEISMSIFRSDPWELPGNLDHDRYFFTNKESNHGRSRRATWGGLWKDTGAEKQIVGPKRMPIVGIRKTLAFFKGKYPRATKTNWIMHVYCIALPCCIQKRSSSQGSLIPIGNWVLCHVFLQKNSPRPRGGLHVRNRNVDYHLPTEDSRDSDASSSLSNLSSPYSDSSVHSEVSSSTFSM